LMFLATEEKNKLGFYYYLQLNSDISIMVTKLQIMAPNCHFSTCLLS